MLGACHAAPTSSLKSSTHLKFKKTEKSVEGFTKKDNVNKLVYYEVFEDIENAIVREKQIKGGSRAKKIKLIGRISKEWQDLYSNL